MLKPGGRFVFAGEPTGYGDHVARRLSRLTWRATPASGKLPAVPELRQAAGTSSTLPQAAVLEAVVDIHTFAPAGLARSAAQRAPSRSRSRPRSSPQPGSAGRCGRSRRRGPGPWAGRGRCSPYHGWQRVGGGPTCGERGPGGPVLQRARRPAPEARLMLIAACSPRCVSPRAALPAGPVPPRDPARRRPSPRIAKWIWRHRAWGSFYLPRYWRFFMLRKGEPAHRHRGLRVPRRAARHLRPQGLRPDGVGRWRTSARATRCGRTRARCGSARSACSARTTPSTPTSTSSSAPRRSSPTGCTSATSTTCSPTSTCRSRTRAS